MLKTNILCILKEYTDKEYAEIYKLWTLKKKSNTYLLLTWGKMGLNWIDSIYIMDSFYKFWIRAQIHLVFQKVKLSFSYFSFFDEFAQRWYKCLKCRFISINSKLIKRIRLFQNLFLKKAEPTEGSFK